MSLMCIIHILLCLFIGQCITPFSYFFLRYQAPAVDCPFYLKFKAMSRPIYTFQTASGHVALYAQVVMHISYLLDKKWLIN